MFIHLIIVKEWISANFYIEIRRNAHLRDFIPQTIKSASPRTCYSAGSDSVLWHRQSLSSRGSSAPRRGGIRLEVELVDVVLGEHMRRTEENLAAVDDLEFAQFAGLKLSGAGL